MEEVNSNSKRSSSSSTCLKFIYAVVYILTLTLLFVLLKLQSSEVQLSSLTSSQNSISASPARVATFLPLKDLQYAGGAMNGNTWFMSSLNDTIEGDEAEYLHFPSMESKEMVLCIKGRDRSDGSKNSYAVVSRKELPESATLLKGLTFVSETYYDYGNLWHGLNAMMPFVGWSMNNKCAKPNRWALYHWGELRLETGSWLHHLMEASFGEMVMEGFAGEGNSSYCFEESVVMRHDLGRMGREKKIMVCEALRCKARQTCGIKKKKGKEGITRMTLLLRKGSRSFKNDTLVRNVFAEECGWVEGCELKVVWSDPKQSFCDQVELMTETDVVVSPHGAQLTNMLFMDRGSSVMEFFPRGWREYAGVGQYAHHWMAAISGMNHEGAWWEPLGKTDCPVEYKDQQCFLEYYKDGKVGDNETYFAEWARKVIQQVRERKLQPLGDANMTTYKAETNDCAC